MDRLQIESHAVVLQRERRARRLAWALLLVGIALTAAAPPAAALTQFLIGGAGAFLLMRAFGRTPQVDGTSTLLPTVARMTASHGAAPLAHVGADTRVLLARVQEVMASRGRAGASARLGALDRKGRSFEAWRGALGGLARGGAGGGSYRDTALEVDDLARVLEDGAAPAERRIAAAVALASSGDPALKRRVRVAAGTCADQALRDAIERAAEEELQERDLDRVLRLRAD